MLSPAAEAALQRLDTLDQCWRAVNDLMMPETDLHLVNRNDLAVLLDFLRQESEEAKAIITQSLRV